MNDFYEKTIETREIYQGNILKLRKDTVRLPDGKTSSREIVEHSGGVTILPVTEEKEIIMIKQFRKPTEEVILELPAGKLEPGEEPEACAQRELREETSYQAGSLEKICSFYTSPGYSEEVLHLFMAEDLEYDKQASPDDGEFIETFYLNPADILDLIHKGRLKDSKTLIGLLYYLKVWS